MQVYWFYNVAKVFFNNVETNYTQQWNNRKLN